MITSLSVRQPWLKNTCQKCWPILGSQPILRQQGYKSPPPPPPPILLPTPPAYTPFTTQNATPLCSQHWRNHNCVTSFKAATQITTSARSPLSQWHLSRTFIFISNVLCKNTVLQNLLDEKKKRKKRHHLQVLYFYFFAFFPFFYNFFYIDLQTFVSKD